MYKSRGCAQDITERADQLRSWRKYRAHDDIMKGVDGLNFFLEPHRTGKRLNEKEKGELNPASVEVVTAAAQG